MAYATVNDLEERMSLVRLNGLVPEPAAQRASILASVITRASDRMDGYLSARFATPVPASGYMQELCMSICEFDLYRRGSGPSVPEKVRQAYEDAIKDLKELADGKRDIGGATPATPDGDATGVNMLADTAVLDSASLAGW